MITRILHLQSTHFGQELERNGVMEYEDDGKTEALVFFSQNQALDVLKKRTAGMRARDVNDYGRAIMDCGLPVASETAPLVIEGAGALLIRAVRESMRLDVFFASDSRARIQPIFLDLGESGHVCAMSIIDTDTARHVYVLHSKSQCRDALRAHREACSTGVIYHLMEIISESALPETSVTEPVHIEHDAAAHVGLHVEFTWCVQNGKIKLPPSTPSALP